MTVSATYAPLDTTPPTLAISGMPATVSDTSTLTLTFTWSEDVTGFAGNDLTYANLRRLWNFSGSGKVYTVDAIPTAARSPSVGVRANAAVDAAGNRGPTSAVSVTARYVAPDTTPPTLAISGMPSTVSSRTPISLTFTWSESVTGFAASDITTTGGALSGFSGSGDTYTATLTPAAAQSPSVSVAANAASDAAGNDGPTTAVTATATYVAPDTTPPTLAVSGVPATYFDRTPFTITFTWSEVVTGFTVGDIVGSGVAISNFSGSGRIYTATGTPTAAAVSGASAIYVIVVRNAARDTAGNTGPAANATTTINYLVPDTTRPTVAISGMPATVSDTAPISLTFRWSEDVTGFDVTDITALGVLSSFQRVSASVYTVTLTPTTNHNASVTITAGAAADGAGNTGPATAVTALATWQAAVDTTRPTVAVTGAPASYTGTSSFRLTFTWSEPVTGFDISDIFDSGAVASNFAGSGAVYTVDITPTAIANQRGDSVFIIVLANRASDASGNTGPAANFVTTIPHS